MSERTYPSSIVAIREVRPAEDLSLLKAHEARRLFDIETVEQPFETRSALREERYPPISAPLMLEPASDLGTDTDTDTGMRPVGPSRSDDLGPAPAVQVKREGTPALIPEPAAPPRRDWLLQPEPQVVPEPQPFGDDPARVRELLQWFVDGRAASSIIQAPRAAGDLVDRPSGSNERPDQVRSVRSAQRLA